MATLYEIDNNILQVLNSGFVVDEDTGEILFDDEDIEALEEERGKKIEGCALLIKSLEAEAAAIKAEQSALADRCKAKENKADRLREYLKSSLLLADQSNFETSKCALSFRKSESVEIMDASQIPLAYMVQPKMPEPRPDKTAIKKSIKDGNAVPGACVIEKQNLQVK